MNADRNWFPKAATYQANSIPRVLAISCVTAWTVLWLWNLGPYARYLDHGDWTQAGILGALCGVPTDASFAEVLLSSAGWMLMVIAMMGPTLAPRLKRAPTRSHAVTFVFGYLIVWLVYGGFAHLVGVGVENVSQNVDYLTFNGWIIGVGLFAIAGAFQLSGQKRKALERCCDDGSFDQSARRSAPLVAGVSHGVACVKCCWALMLLMFAFWPGNLMWMIVLSLMMVSERVPNLRFAPHRYLGVALLASASCIAAIH